jgi:hypothetical protein
VQPEKAGIARQTPALVALCPAQRLLEGDSQGYVERLYAREQMLGEGSAVAWRVERALGDDGADARLREGVDQDRRCVARAA